MDKVDNIVVGGGHAGIEAALSITRMGGSVLLVTNTIDSIGRMSCNPAIGGLAKSHLVYEIDALGGVMGEAADVSAIQYKTLNKSKGRAVWSSRAQVDKRKYSSYVKNIILNNKSITVMEDEVVDICVDSGMVSGLHMLRSGFFSCCNIIITSGTFLTGLIHIGTTTFKAGRIGEKASFNLSKSLKNIGLELSRLKTGTPPRLLSSTVNWSLCDLAPGDSNPYYFSTRTDHKKSTLNIPCYTVNTNKNTHEILHSNLGASAMFSGKIDGVGPRYCPSIEDKVVRFSDRPSHQLFLEPEWENSNQIYLNGFSTSMPKSVQVEALRSIPALRDVELIRPGYAIEYDYIPSFQLKSSLESKLVSGLFFAGQINGTSGYEEAAAQGLVAGANAQCSLLNRGPFSLLRSEAYIGVLVDDLITKTINEPYRMFTSRAEHRLFLRPETAGFRLSDKGERFGLTGKRQCKNIKDIKVLVDKVLDHLKKTPILSSQKKPNDAYSCVLRGDIDIYTLSFDFIKPKQRDRVLFIAETEIKYKGYVDIETKKINALKKMENVKIPLNIIYSEINNLSSESVEKLSIVLPQTLGQASRIDGVRASDISSLSAYIKNKQSVSRETL